MAGSTDDASTGLQIKIGPDDPTRVAKKRVDLDGDTLPLDGVTPVRDELPFGGVIGRYLVLSVLGHGGMGVVYAAFDPVLDRKIAVKLLKQVFEDDATEGRARMHREAQALARLTHPNVITVHDVSEHSGAMYIAMELVTGGTLRDWQRGKSWREIVEKYTLAARGLAAAHTAGLIHRDFKPENVLVGDDGRVRVTDFGLARLAHDAPEVRTTHQSPTSLSTSLTAAGAVMGTPSYMAPEQIDGGTVDARSDQFSWCIALWEALYGEQPFPGTNLALRSAAMKAESPKVPAQSTVPRGLGRLLVRGLDAEPGKRWPSLDALLDELERIASPQRTYLGAGVALAVAALAIVFVVGRNAGSTTASCDEAAAPIETLWSPAAKAEVGAGFAATGVPFAVETLASVDRSITAWRERWRAVALESCRATRVSATQSEAVLELRSGCLVRRRDELQMLIGALAHADRKLVESAATMATRLPDLEACSDSAVLAATAPPPSDPGKQQARAVLEPQLDRLEAETLGGVSIPRAHELETQGKAAVAAAIAIGWSPLVARARQDLAEVQHQLGDGKHARATLIDAAASASAAGDADRLVESYLALIEVEARLTSDYALGDGWATLAEGTLARLGPRDDKQERIDRARGLVAERAGRLEDARAAYQAALVLARARGPVAELVVLRELGNVETDMGELAPALADLEKARDLALHELGEHHPKLASIRHDLGGIAYRQGKYAEAEQLYRQALAVREEVYGADDVTVAGTIEALSVTELAEGKLDASTKDAERAIHIFEQRLGADHPDVANALNDIGGAYHRAGDYARALATNLRALAVREKALGPDHPDVAQSLINCAIESKALGKWDIVEPNYRRAIAIFEKTYGPQHLDTGISRLNFAEALRVEGKLDEAGVEYEKSRAIMVKNLGEDHPILANIWNGVGQLELARGHTALAIPLLERAVAVREKDPGDQPALAESRFALARAITASPATRSVAEANDKTRAEKLAIAARDAFRAAGSGYTKEASAIDAWLAKH